MQREKDKGLSVLYSKENENKQKIGLKDNLNFYDDADDMYIAL